MITTTLKKYWAVLSTLLSTIEYTIEYKKALQMRESVAGKKNDNFHSVSVAYFKICMPKLEKIGFAKRLA